MPEFQDKSSSTALSDRKYAIPSADSPYILRETRPSSSLELTKFYNGENQMVKNIIARAIGVPMDVRTGNTPDNQPDIVGDQSHINQQYESSGWYYKIPNKLATRLLLLGAVSGLFYGMSSTDNQAEAGSRRPNLYEVTEVLPPDAKNSVFDNEIAAGVDKVPKTTTVYLGKPGVGRKFVIQANPGSASTVISWPSNFPEVTETPEEKAYRIQAEEKAQAERKAYLERPIRKEDILTGKTPETLKKETEERERTGRLLRFMWMRHSGIY